MSTGAMLPSQKAHLAVKLSELARHRVCASLMGRVSCQGADCRICTDAAQAALSAVDDFAATNTVEIRG
ncbi:MAG TPA: hypothetical protein VEA35_00515 [Ramlibacter sp.]|nr:hypothetical protein [Ramlibacter sp.]